MHDRRMEVTVADSGFDEPREEDVQGCAPRKPPLGADNTLTCGVETHPERLEAIRKRHFTDTALAELQDRIIDAVQRNPDSFLERYARDPRSHRGRYINSDLMKETFPEYRASRETRLRYNNVVHNAAAVLASEQFRRACQDTAASARDAAMFLTGSPGAGKTTHVLASGRIPVNVRVLYEGQLSDWDSHSKIQFAIDAGLAVEITVVHAKPETALANTLHRIETVGRGASIESMARIQGGLPESLTQIHGRFDDRVSLVVVDRRQPITRQLSGWQHLSELESEGSYEEIRKRLHAELERRRAGLSEAAYRQARG